MYITAHNSQVRSLTTDDPRFLIKDKFTVTPRAGFEISEKCPQNYAMIIANCIDKGWLKPIANITERELVFMGLSNDA
jgi:hypothetical protein